MDMDALMNLHKNAYRITFSSWFRFGLLQIHAENKIKKIKNNDTIVEKKKKAFHGVCF